MKKASSRRLVVATRNGGKLLEVTSFLSDLGLEFLSLRDFPDFPPVLEDGSTFWENAEKKARAAAQYTNLPALADDSGLEVDYLGGAPGVLSARFAGREGDDEANNAKLLRLLKGVPLKDRTARFRCVLAVVTPAGGVIAVEGTIEGYIATEPRGSGGFGYDPLFVIPEYNCTMAELDLTEKNRISHRGKALAKLRERLETIFA